LFRRCLEPRRRIDRALLAVAMEASVHGTSTRKVDDLVKALGVETGISKSEVSRICAELDRCGRTPDLLKERSRPGVGSGKSTLSRGPRAHPPCGEAGVVELAVAGGGKWAQPAGYTAAR
jgi:hypothetical protein